MKNQTSSFYPSIEVLYLDSCNIQFLMGPIEKGFGTPFANLFRKVLLKYSIGTGIIGLQVNNLKQLNQYTKLPGVVENVNDILINAKHILFKVDSPNSLQFVLQRKGPCKVYTSDLIVPRNVTLLNSNSYLFTIHDESQIKLLFHADSGYGFIPAEYFGLKKNTVFTDINFTPIVHISYYVRNYSTYEELVFYIKTNGIEHPKSIVESAFRFLSKKTNPFYKESQIL